MKIAICDESLDDIKQLEKYIEESEFCPKHSYFFEYLKGEDLLNNYKGFDVIFLDIYIGNRMNGILTAQKIRKHDSNVLISFYSEFEVPASKVSTIHPYNYILKNYSLEKLKENLDIILREAQNKSGIPKIPVICKGQIYILRLSDIIYIQIYKKGCQIWLSDKKKIEISRQTIETSFKLKDYYLMLNQFGFIYAGESYLINAEKVIERDKTSVLLQGGYNLPVARRKKKIFDEELIQYYKNKYNL